MKMADVIVQWQRNEPLLRGVLLQRYKRFLSDIRLDSGETVVAHCVNTGAMEGLTEPGTVVWLSRADNPKRKLLYTWELAEINGRILGVNTGLPNRIVARLLAEQKLPWLAQWPEVRAEKKYGEKSRVDFWMSDQGCEHYLEVKNCHLVYPDHCAYFPDCVSARAAGHLHELVASIAQANAPSAVTAEVLFCVQIAHAKRVRPSDIHDPTFAAAARDAASRGVRFSAIGVDHSEEAITVYGPIPVDMQPYDTANHERWRQKNRTAKTAAELQPGS